MTASTTLDTARSAFEPGSPAVKTPSAAVGMAIALGTATLLQSVCAVHLTTVLPDIQATFPTAQTMWVSAAFFLAAAVAAPLGGRVADLLGARRVAVTGLLAVMLASLVAITSASATVLVAARALLGIGCAVQFPAALTILRTVGSARTPMVLGVIALSAELAFTTAPTINTLLGQVGGWRLVLATPVAAALIALVALLCWVPAQPKPWPGARRLWIALDVPGIAVGSAAVVVLLVWLLALPIAVRWSLLAVVPILVGLTWMWERVFAAAPVLPGGLFTHPTLVLTITRHALFFTAFSTLYFGLPSWLAGRGLSPMQIAVMLVALPLIAILTRFVAPSVQRVGARRVLLMGASALALAAAAAVVLGGDASVVTAMMIVALLGPAGLVNHANQAVLYAIAPAERTGTISGIYRSVQALAGGLAAALAQISGGAQGFHLLAVVAGVGALVLIGASTTGTCAPSLDEASGTQPAGAAP